MDNLKSIFMSLLLITHNASAGLIDIAERFWTFDNTFNDSKIGLVGTATGGASFGVDRDGNLGGALYLDGYDDSVQVALTNDLSPLSDFTISLWFSVEQRNGRSYIFDTRGANSTSSNYAFFDTNPTINAHLSGNSIYAGEQAIIDQNWHNLILTNDSTAGQSRLFLDGSLVGQTSAKNPQDFNGGLTFGTYGSASIGGQYWLNGSIDDVGLWGQAFDQDNVNEIYNMKASATQINEVSEPESLALFTLALLGLGIRRLKKA